VTNTHVSKGNDFNFAFKLCCKRSSGTPGKVCGDGNIDNPNDDGDTEVCDGDDGCGAGLSCNDQCTACVVAPVIKLAEWRKAKDTVEGYERAYKAALDDEIILYGKTENYNEGDKFKIQVFKKVRRGESEPVSPEFEATLISGEIRIDSRPRIAPFTGNVLRESFPEVSDLVGSGAQEGEDYTFMISHFNEEGVRDNFLESDPLQIDNGGIVTNYISECGLIKPIEFEGLSLNEAMNLCSTTRSTSILDDPAYCNKGSETVECKWSGDDKCVNELKRITPGGVIGTCTYTVEYDEVCTDGFRDAKITTEYTGGDTICENDCQGKVLQNIPCGRAFLSLPFFTAWQIVGAVIVLFLIYFILLRTKVIGKRSEKKMNRKKK